MQCKSFSFRFEFERHQHNHFNGKWKRLKCKSILCGSRRKREKSRQQQANRERENARAEKKSSGQIGVMGERAWRERESAFCVLCLCGCDEAFVRKCWFIHFLRSGYNPAQQMICVWQWCAQPLVSILHHAQQLSKQITLLPYCSMCFAYDWWWMVHVRPFSFTKDFLVYECIRSTEYLGSIWRVFGSKLFLSRSFEIIDFNWNVCSSVGTIIANRGAWRWGRRWVRWFGWNIRWSGGRRRWTHLQKPAKLAVKWVSSWRRAGHAFRSKMLAKMFVAWRLQK